MTRLLYLLLMTLPACSFLNDYDGYSFESDAGLEETDRRKPARGVDGGLEEGETGPTSREDASQGPLEPLDAGTVTPAPDAAQGAPEGGSGQDAAPDALASSDGATPAPDAAQGAPEGGSGQDAAPDAPRAPDGLEGAWAVSLPLRSSSCTPAPAASELDEWLLERAGPGAGVLYTGWGRFEGTLQQDGTTVAAASFGADVGVAHYTIELWLGPRGVLAGQITIEPLGAGRCVVMRAIEGTR